ncbi:MAG: hypothetical protein ACOCUN_02765 [Jiangellaceae bacterium]
MLRRMRDADGRPTTQARMLALLVVVGMLALFAPAVAGLVL